MEKKTHQKGDRRCMRLTANSTATKILLEDCAGGMPPEDLLLQKDKKTRYLLDVSLIPAGNSSRLISGLLEIHFCRKIEESGQEGLRQITPREKEVLSLVLLGATNKKAAQQLGVTEGTVKKLLSNCYRKLGVRSRSEALIKYYS